MNPELDLVIFDCDGVLVDSERVANEVFARVLAEVCGLQFTLEEMFDTFVGHSRLQCLQKIEALIGAPPPAELDRRYQQDINRALEQSVVAIEGIAEVLEQLSLPSCVASSGSHEKMQMTLGKTGFSIFSRAIYSAPARLSAANRIPISTCTRRRVWVCRTLRVAWLSKTARSVSAARSPPI